jgi:small subunit ribosomal protein S21
LFIVKLNIKSELDEEGRMEQYIEVKVYDNDVERAIVQLSDAVRSDGKMKIVFRKQAYEKPSEKKIRKRQESLRRARRKANKKWNRRNATEKK